MEQVANLVRGTSQAAAASNIKFAMSSNFIYKLMRDKLLKEEKEEPERPLHTDNVLGPMKPVMKLYQTLTTLAHLISFSVTLGLICYRQDKLIRDNNVIFCHTPRFAVHAIIGPYYMTWLACSFSLLQLSWRLCILFEVINQHHLQLDTFTYLMFDDELVRSHLDPQQALKSYTTEQGLNLAQRVMFYRVEAESHNTVALGLRPNRTPEARERLLKVVHLSFQLCTTTFIFIQVVFGLVTLWTSAFNIDFYYPGCEPSSSLLHIATRSIGSFVMSVIIIFDCYGVYLFSYPLKFILIEDLKIYWRKIEQEMMELYRLIREHRYAHDQRLMKEVDEEGRKYSFCHERSIKSLKIFHDHHFRTQQQVKNKTKKKRMSIQVSQIGSLSYQTDSYDTFELRERIYVFQTVMCDFFDRLSEIDGYMTLTLAMTFLIWLTTNGVVSYIGVQTDTTISSLLIRNVQFFMLLLFCSVSAIILNLKSYIDPAYRILNSIMAYDTSMEKQRWLYLLKYYTVIPRHCFTIFRFTVFSSLIFFQSFSYTLSYSLYMYGIKPQG